MKIRVGERVLVKTQTKKDKFQFIYDGPFEVTESYDEYVEIRKDGKKFKIHKNLLKKFNEDTTFPNVELTDTNVINFIQSY